MKTKHLLLFVLLLAGMHAAAQTYQRLYDGSFNDCADVAWCEYDQTYINVSIAASTGEVKVIKTSATGVPVWHMSYEVAAQVYFDTDIAITSDGTIFIAGVCSAQGFGRDYYVLTLFSWGQLWWCRSYSPNEATLYTPPSLSILPDGNLLLTESAHSYAGFIKLDPAGNVMFSDIYREYQDTNAVIKTTASDFFPDGAMIFTGCKDLGMMIIKTDINGQMLWSRVMSSPPDSAGVVYYTPTNIIALDDGSSIVCGYDQRQAFVTKLDTGGSMVWYRRIDPASYTGFRSYFYDMEQVDPDTFVLAGATDNPQRPFLAKIDGNGNLLASVALYDTMSILLSTNVTVNPAGQIAWPVTVYSAQHPGFPISLHLLDDVIASGCSMTTGTLSFQQSGVEMPALESVSFYTSQQLVSTNVQSAIAFPLTITYNDWCWVVGTEERPAAETVLNVCNTLPDAGTPLYFSLGEYAGDIRYTVHDMNGRLVMSTSGNINAGEEVSISAQTFAAGLYVLTVEAGEKAFVEKFVVRE